MKNTVTIGMIGAGRATELHMGAYDKVYGVTVRRKWIFDKFEDKLTAAKDRYGFENITTDYDDILNDSEVDVVDICTPPYLHREQIIRALNAGKNVICEKPLTGYFGCPDDEKPIGNVSREKMYKGCLHDLELIEEAIKTSEKQLMYAENFVYAPAMIKAAEIIRAKKSRILFAKGEESLNGSSSPVAGEWEMTGGGTFIRTGTHPLSAILWLKQQEAEARGVEISVKSVLADMARITPNLTEYEHRHIAARPHDVEDFGIVTLEFTDMSRAAVIATDTLLSGSRNYVELYCNDAVLNCTLTLNNLMSSYFLDEDGLDNVQISEMLPSKIGWNNPFISDEIIRGYTNEIQDFMEAVAFDRKAKSDFEVARDTAKVIYAAYLSSELGGKVTL